VVSRDAVLVDLRRALGELRPDDAEPLLGEVERRLRGGGKRHRLGRSRLVEELEPALRQAFPSRADRLILELTRELWPAGVLGPVPTVFAVGPGAQALAARDVAVDLEPDDYPSLVVVGPRPSPFLGLRLLVHLDSMVLGSREGCDFALADPGLAPRHLMITRDATGGVLVEDLGSESGVLVNAKRIHWTWVTEGDEIRAGGLTLRFVAPSS